MERPALKLELVPEAFLRCGQEFQRADGTNHKPESRLVGVVEILGVLLHLELIEVQEVGGEQKAVIDELESSLDAACEISRAALFGAVTYNHRSYLLLLTPQSL